MDHFQRRVRVGGFAFSFDRKVCRETDHCAGRSTPPHTERNCITICGERSGYKSSALEAGGDRGGGSKTSTNTAVCCHKLATLLEIDSKYWLLHL